MEFKNDWECNSFRSALILTVYRVCNHLYVHGHHRLCAVLNGLWEIIKPFFNINCQISYKAAIGREIRLPHIGNGTVISGKAIIGNGVTIYHQVTIGINENKPFDQQKVIIGDNVYLSCGAKIISCTVGGG